MRLILEPRFLFDASLASVRQATRDTNDTHHEHNHDVNHAPAAHAAGHESRVLSPATADAKAERAVEAPAAVATPSVLFVDPRVANWQTLAAGVAGDTKVIVLDPNQDGLKQVSAGLAELRDVQTVNFLTYGTAGEIQLGASRVDAANLLANAGQVAGWRDHLSDHAQIQLWGCDVGAGAGGAAFVADLHALTGAGVAASTDATGAASLGGDWSLERIAGAVAVNNPFSAEAVAAFAGVLDAPVPTVTITGAPAQLLLGSDFTETVRFSNTAANGVGYGPVIDVFVPNNVNEAATLNSASYLGTTLPVSSVTLSTTVVGHIGVLGALDPVEVDSTGAALFVQAPAGAVAGDRMYVVQLPFGSYTPGQPAADVTLNFSSTKTGTLTAVHPAQSMVISAIGGFIYGADPLNNPATDAPIRGIAGSPSTSTVGDGLVTATSPVALLTATATVATNPGEGESATGPDFVEHYQVTLTGAPATIGNAITALKVQVTLPDNVQYTGGSIGVTGSGSGSTPSFTAGSAPQGGSVALNIASFSASAGTTTIDIPVYVPKTDASGANILDPVTGAAAGIASPISVYTNGSWTPWAGSVDAGTTVPVSGTAVTSAAFTGKSLAMQQSVIDLTSGATYPGDTLQYTLKFEVSDYFNMGGLTLQALLNDGLVIDPSVAPILSLTPAGGSTTTINLGAITPSNATVNGELVPTTGSNTVWNFSRDNVTAGVTTANFDAGAAMLGALGSTTLSAGETGTLVFRAKVLDKYTNTNIDPVTGKPASITERDGVSSSSTATATVLTTAGLPTATPAKTISDTSSAASSVPAGSATIFIAAINNVAVSGAAAITAGDTVTYGITYTLSTGDYRALDLSAYIPLPVLSVTDPNATGGSVAAFTQDNVSALFPVSGSYKLVTAPAGVAVQSALVNGTSNGITFDLGHRDDLTNVQNQTVTVYFTATTNTKPFADGLLLTTQGQSSHTNGTGALAAVVGIRQITLQEPNLVGSVKTGVVSLVDNALSAKTNAGYTLDGTATVADPTSLYKDAGTAGTPFVGASTGPGSVGTLQNLNVTGADGGDTVRITVTVANTGSGSGGAYDVIVSDTLPTGYTAADVSNITYTRSGTTLTALSPTTPPGAGAANLFSATGVMLEDPTSTSGAPKPTLYASRDAQGRNVLTISYDLKLKPGQSAGSVLTETASVVNYTNIYNGVALGNGFVVGGNPVGGSAASLTDTATVTTVSPSLARSFGASSITADDITDPSTGNPVVAVGNPKLITLTLTVPEGGLTGVGGADVLVTDALAANETFNSFVSITSSSGLAFTTPGTPWSVSGSTVTFDLGASVINSNSDHTTPPNGAGTITIKYLATFGTASTYVNSNPNNGTVFTNTAALSYSGTAVPTVSGSFTERDPILTGTLTDNSGGAIYSGQTITYTYVVKNTGLVLAQNTQSLLQLAAGLTYNTGSLSYVSSTTTPDSITTVNEAAGSTPSGSFSGSLQVLPGVLDAGGTITYTFSATVKPNLAAGTDLSVLAPAAVSGAPASFGRSINTGLGATYEFSTSDVHAVQTLVPTLTFASEANGTATVTPGVSTSISAVVGDVARLHAVLQLPEGSNTGTVLDFALPTGFTAFNDGTIKLVLVSPSGSITSSVLDPAGNTAGLQLAEGGTPITPATTTPTYVVPSGAIDTSTPGHLKINLGTLTNNDGSAVPNYVIAEFNAQVANVASNVDTTALGSTLTVQANGTSSTTATATATVKEPRVTLAKVVTAIDQSAGSVTYKVTLTNTGDAIAYNVALTDPLPTNIGSISSITTAGGATGLSVTPGSGNIFAANMTLGIGATETFTYTVTLASPLAPVLTTTTTETFQDLQVGLVSFAGSTIGAVGSATGSRDCSAIPGAGINNYWAQATAGIGTVAGSVWEALGNTPGVYDGAIDTQLAGVQITIVSSGSDGIFGNADDLTETTTTALDGSFKVGLLPAGSPYKVTLPATGALGLPASETLVYNATGNITTLPATTTRTAIAGAQTGTDFAYEKPDTAPVLSNWASGFQTIRPGDVAQLSTTGAAGTSDAELARLIGADPVTYSYAGAVLTLQRYVGGVATPNTADSFGGDAQLSLTGGNVVLSGATVGTFTQTGGVLSITLGSATTAATVSGLLNHLTYSNATTGTLALNLTIGATLSDGNTSSVALQNSQTTGKQGTGGVKTSAVVNSVFSLLPQVSPTATTFTEPNDATPAPLTLPPVTLANLLAPGATLSGATLALGGGFTAAEDRLAFTNTSGQGNIAGSYNSTTGVLALTSAGNTATAAQWQAAISAVTYVNLSDTPQTTTRSVTYSFTDATTSAVTTAQLASVAVVAADDSPILNTGITLSLPHATEDVTGAPSGAVGALVSTLSSATNVTDPDGANAQNGGAIGPYGLAVVGADTTIGNWWYSTDGGTSWTKFAGSGLTAMSGTNALHLVANANTRIYFQPTTANFNGSIAPALTIRAWDQFDGVSNGVISALPVDAALGTGINKLASAYSSATVAINLVVDPVNDAPVASGTSTLAVTAEDTGNPPGATVATLFAGNFSDATDQQFSGGNPTGSVANTLAGVAIIGNTTPSAEGVWRYSTDGGATWTNISTSVTDSSALIIPVTARIDFLPAANFNGAPPPLTVRLIDTSTDVPITTGVTGATLAAGTSVYTGIDVSGGKNGGTNAVSAASVLLNTTVSAVNDAPVGTGAATLVSVAEDVSAPPGATVTSLFTANFSDTVDQQLSGINPTGSVANTLAGVAVIGNTTPPSEGVWRYSTDGGATWTTISMGVSDISALILPGSARISFLPVANFNGAPPPLTVRVIDTSSDVVITTGVTGAILGAGSTIYTGIDVSGAKNGGITAVSATTTLLNTAVTAVNDAPVATGSSTLTTVPEDTTSAGAPGATVATLFAANFTDTTDTQVSGINPTGSTANTLAGVAITGNTTPASEGVWRYSTDGGTTWTNISTSVSDSSAVIIPVTARIDFLPATNFNGAPPPLTVRLIDTSTDVPITTGVTGATLASGTTVYTGIDVSGAKNGGTTAVSSTGVQLNTAVSAVNDAPVASGSSTLTSVPEDTVSAGAPGATVTSLFTANFDDATDTQVSGINPTGSVANTLAGVAIIGNTTPSSEGVWRYSTDGGATWTNISTSVTDSSALILPGSARIDFLPAANFNGAPPPLTVRLIDTSTDVPITAGVTGATLASGTTVYTGIDVSGTKNGGTTAVSATAVPLNTAITAVNDAPVASGSSTLASVPEDTTSVGAPGATVVTLFAANFNDVTDAQVSGINPTGSVANTLAGVAIIGNTTPSSEGVWRYSTDGGTTWTNISTGVSDSSALILPGSARIDFLPVANFNGAPPPLTVRLIDASTDVPITAGVTGAILGAGSTIYTGIDVSGAKNGGTTAVSAASVLLNTAVTAVNDAPVASGSSTLTTVPEDTTSACAPGATVATLFAANFTDTTDTQVSGINPTGSVANTLAGVAITGNTTPASEGVWRYSKDGGTTWTNISTGVSDSSAVIIPVTARIDFLPAANFNGAPPPLTVRLIDTSTDLPITTGVTGATLAAGSTAFTGIDVSGAKNGGTTAVSAIAVPLNTAVSAVNDAPVASGSSTLASVPEDSTTAPGATVTSLFTANFNDSTDTQVSGINPTGSTANTLAGVAITGNTTPSSEGVWRYSTDGGTTWTNISTGVSDSSALILPGAARIDFLPAANFNGAPPPLTVRLIDTSTDVPISTGVTGATLGSGTTVYTGIDVSGAKNGGITAVSATAVPLNTAITAVNDAPVASGSSTLTSIPEDSGSTPGATVTSLFTPNFNDATDTQASGINPTGSTANTLAGVAITGNTTPAAEGVWRYSTDGGTSWTNISTGVSDSSALILPGSARIDFLPVANFNGAPPPLTVRLIDSSTDVPVTTGVTGATLGAGSTAYTGIDVSGAKNGGITAVSATSVPLNTAVTAVNDAPIASGTSTLTTVPEDTASGAAPGATIGTLFGGNFNDSIDTQATGLNPTGSVANTLAGVAVTGNTTPSSEGVWRYSTDGGTTWTNISIGVSDSSALILPVAARIDFLPAANFNGAPPPLTVRLVDTSTDVPITAGVTGATLAGGNTVYSGIDVSGAKNGGTTAISATSVPLNTAVSAINDAPIASGSSTLTSVPEDSTIAPGATVTSLFAANFSDTTDQQLSGINPAGSMANTLAGVAITGNTTPASEGVWRYSTDGGVTWTNISTGVSDSSAIILPGSARIDFLPVANFNGAPPPLTVRLIDISTDVPITTGVTGASLAAGNTAFTGIDVSGAKNGGTAAISATSVPLNTAVTAVNDAPVASGSSTLTSVPEDSASAPGATVATLFGGNFNDSTDTQTSGINPTGSVANTLAGVAITGNTTPSSEGVWRYSTDGGTTWTNISTSVSDSSAVIIPVTARIDFLPAANFNGAPPPLTVRLIDTSTDVPITTGVTGASLAAGNTAFTGVDVSGAKNGGTTAISAATTPLSTSITAVNDAPIASGTSSLPTISGNTTNPPGDTVGNLFTSNFTDTVDQQKTSLNPTGSVSNTLAGVVVVANPVPAGDGTWRYSTDGGSNWVAIPTTVSDTNGLVLGTGVKIAFFPSGTFSGAVPPLQVRLIDNSTDVPLSGTTTGGTLAPTGVIANVDVSNPHSGGITGVSNGLVPLGLNVTQVGNPPIHPSTPLNPFAPIGRLIGDGGLPPGWLVGSTIYRSLTTEQSGVINVSADAFYGSDASQHLSYDAGTASGGPLPPWLTFDPATLAFSGVPPITAAGTLDLRVVARDQNGRQATAEVHLFITRDPTDLLSLLRATRINRTETPRQPLPRPGLERPAPDRQTPAQGPNRPATTRPATTALPGRGNFTAQLRENSAAGRLAQARGLLSTIADLPPRTGTM